MEKVKTVQVSVGSYVELNRLKGVLEFLVGKKLNYDVVVRFLLESMVDWVEVYKVAESRGYFEEVS